MNITEALLKRIIHDVLSSASSLPLILSDVEHYDLALNTVNKFLNHFKLLRSVLDIDTIKKLHEVFPDHKLEVISDHIALPIGLLAFDSYKPLIAKEEDQHIIINISIDETISPENSIKYYALELLKEQHYKITIDN